MAAQDPQLAELATDVRQRLERVLAQL